MWRSRDHLADGVRDHAVPQHYLLHTHVCGKVTRSRETFGGVGTVPDVPWISIGSEAFTSSITLSAYPSNLPSAVCFAAHCCFQIGRWLPGLSEHKQMRGGDGDDAHEIIS